MASVKLYGLNAIKNFDIRHYNCEAILQSNLEPRKEQAAILLQQSPTTQALLPLTHQHVPETPRLINFDIVNNEKKRLRSSAEIQVSEKSRKRQAGASALSCQHGGVLRPFCSYAKTKGKSQSSEEQKETPSFGFQHAISSAFRRYKAPKSGEFFNMQEGVVRSLIQHQISDCLPPYQINYFKELELRTLGLGFKHASSSCFKPYKSQVEGS